MVAATPRTVGTFRRCPGREDGSAEGDNAYAVERTHRPVQIGLGQPAFLTENGRWHTISGRSEPSWTRWRLLI
jgi:hypothetical protein